VIRPRSQEPWYLFPEPPLDHTVAAIRLCFEAVAAGLIGLPYERGLVQLAAIRGIGARGTRVAGREAFQALPQVVS
jgi:hypothetical protein